MAGGVALNCTSNSKILSAGIFEKIWIQPAAGDAGGALGAAYAAFHIWFKKDKRLIKDSDGMNGSYLGPHYSDNDMLRYLRKYEPRHSYFQNFDELSMAVAKLMADGNVIGWFQDRMEFGPRALGNRSILGDPRNPEMQKRINLKIKLREGFRPFAPAVILEDLHLYFIHGVPSPYMLFLSQLKTEYRKAEPENYSQLDLQGKLAHMRSEFPAVTHIDYSSRVQTVTQESNPKFWGLINEFKKITGHGMIVNTSFNIRGEPIVCTPEDAYLCFIKTGMDYLVIGNYLFDKRQQQLNS